MNFTTCELYLHKIKQILNLKGKGLNKICQKKILTKRELSGKVDRKAKALQYY